MREIERGGGRGGRRGEREGGVEIGREQTFDGSEEKLSPSVSEAQT